MIASSLCRLEMHTTMPCSLSQRVIACIPNSLNRIPWFYTVTTSEQSTYTILGFLVVWPQISIAILHHTRLPSGLHTQDHDSACVLNDCNFSSTRKTLFHLLSFTKHWKILAGTLAFIFQFPCKWLLLDLLSVIHLVFYPSFALRNLSALVLLCTSTYQKIILLERSYSKAADISQIVLFKFKIDQLSTKRSIYARTPQGHISFLEIPFNSKSYSTACYWSMLFLVSQ